MNVMTVVDTIIIIAMNVVPFVKLIIPGVIDHLVKSGLHHDLPTITLLNTSTILLYSVVKHSVHCPFRIPITAVFNIINAILFL